MEVTKINEPYADSTLNVALDTLNINKQALIFVNTKRGAESTAEKIASKIKNIELTELSEKARTVLSRPTRQCERLAKCIKRGIAFHHAGLPAKQRELIEDNFRNGKIKIIASTPTLAIGLNMPAFRTIIRDLKRYGGRWGMQWIPVLEYHQMAGRAGRPGKEDYGESICIASTESEKTHIVDKFVNGDPEEIYSKLAVEPVLRTYVLSLIATGIVRNKSELTNFFSETFWAYQYQDMAKLELILDKMINLLQSWEFLKESSNTSEPNKSSDFSTGFDELNIKSINEKLVATKLGQRVAELYLDPLTANFIITCLKRATEKITTDFSYHHMICSTLEMRPVFRAGVKDFELCEEKIAEVEDDLITTIPSIYDSDYEEFIHTIKTSIVFDEWINEMDEHDILEKYNVRPGEFRAKLNMTEWLLNATAEFAGLLGFQPLIKDIKKILIRLKHGVKEELIPLLRLKNVGRVRARTLYKNNIKDLGDVKKTDLTKLTQLIGPALAKDIKKQIGEEVVEIKPNKRKGQKNVNDY